MLVSLKDYHKLLYSSYAKLFKLVNANEEACFSMIAPIEISYLVNKG